MLKKIRAKKKFQPKKNIRTPKNTYLLVKDDFGGVHLGLEHLAQYVVLGLEVLGDCFALQQIAEDGDELEGALQAVAVVEALANG